MRRLILAAALSILTLAVACKSKPKTVVPVTEEEAPSLASTISVAEPRTAGQLLRGFYGLEQGAWRWTQGKFAVVLRPPREAAQKGATLRLNFSVPEPVLAKLKSVTLTA